MLMNDPLSSGSDPGNNRASEGSSLFREGSLVQLIAGDPGEIDARVMTLRPATIWLGDDRIVAAADASECSWLFGDITRVFHGGDEPWVIFEVPAVPDMGVSVRVDDVEAFRALLERTLPLALHVQRKTPQPPVNKPVLGLAQQAGASAPWSPPVDASFRSTPPPAASPLLSEPADASPPSTPPTLSQPDTASASWFETTTVSDVEAGAPASPTAVNERAFDPGPITTMDETIVMPSMGPTPAAALVGLDARNISAWFGSHQVLDRVSLDMHAGHVTALIGPSGCGKSTFLRILNRMHEMIPSASMAGEVLLDGTDIYDPSRRLTEARRQIGMVFQKPNPFPAMSIYDNVVAGFRLTGTKQTSSAKDQVVETCLRKAGLWNEVRDRLRQPGGSLSGGQQQRLCIARALAIKPRVLLMDEPCSALDPTSTRRIEQTISELVEEVTIVIVTHNMQQAARVSHQSAFFLAEQGTPGVIVEYGPTEAMFDHPQDQRTNDYVNGRFG